MTPESPTAQSGPSAVSHESLMVVVERNDEGTPTIWCDPEIVDLVTALNKGGIRTIASCSGHGKMHGNIALADGRELIIATNFEAARVMDAAVLAAPPAGARDAVTDAAVSLRGLAGVIRKHGTCAPSALEVVAERLEALAGKADGGQRIELCELHGSQYVRGCAYCTGDLDTLEATQPAATGMGDHGSWMGQALHDFTEYFVKNYPGPDTIICDPTWHAPKLFRNALWHIEQAQKRNALAAQPAPMVGGLNLPEDGAYLIRYDDASENDESFSHAGARDAAFARYEQRSSNWNAHLYVKIDSNSRDCEVPNALLAARPGGEDTKRLDWLMRHVSGKELRDMGIDTFDGCTRDCIDAAISAHTAQAGGGRE